MNRKPTRYERFTIETQRGHYYELTREAFVALRRALHGGEADRAFERHAPHVPACDRGDVWQEIPSGQVKLKI